jgi:hypothetical protein
MSWRIVKSSGGAFWLERDSAAGPGAPGESIYFASGYDAAGAFVALERHLALLAEAEVEAFIIAARRELARREVARG